MERWGGGYGQKMRSLGAGEDGFAFWRPLLIFLCRSQLNAALYRINVVGAAQKVWMYTRIAGSVVCGTCFCV
jgi:hypothetical protein